MHSKWEYRGRSGNEEEWEYRGRSGNGEEWEYRGRSWNIGGGVGMGKSGNIGGGVGMLSIIFLYVCNCYPCSEARAIVVHGSDLAVSVLVFEQCTCTSTVCVHTLCIYVCAVFYCMWAL